MSEQCSWAHFYLATTTSRKSKRPLHTTPGYGFNRRSHQPNFLLNFLNVHLSGTQADFKDPSHIFSWWPVICPPSQAPNFLLNHKPFPSQAFSVPCLHNTLTEHNCHWQDLTWLSAQRTPCGPLWTLQGPLQAIKWFHPQKSKTFESIILQNWKTFHFLAHIWLSCFID